jgi:pSer/pThr/pTyr-binding forkhead associated (FHA) protein
MDQGLKQVMTMQISRVHAVVLLDARNTVWLYDAGSTNGTLVTGTKVRSATLAELSTASGPFVARSHAVLGDGIEVELEGPAS